MKRIISRTLLIATLITIIGFGGTAFAYRGWSGSCMGGSGGHYNHGSNYQSDTALDRQDEQHQVFRKETEDLRQDIYAKELELKSELAKKNPNAEKTIELQRQLSKLEGDFDQKRLEHRIKMKKVNPDFNSVSMRDHHRGDSGYGGGYCW